MCLEPKKTEPLHNTTPGPVTASPATVVAKPATVVSKPASVSLVLIDGHKYKDQFGNIHTLTRFPEQDNWVRQMAKDHNWGPGSSQAMAFRSDHTGFWFADVQHGIPGVYTAKEMEGRDPYMPRLVEDVSAPAKPPTGYPLRLPLVAGRKYLSRDGRVVEITKLNTFNDSEAWGNIEGDDQAPGSRRWDKNGVKESKGQGVSEGWDIVGELEAPEGESNVFPPAKDARPDEVTLVLTKDEAETLRQITANIAGCQNSPRKFSDSISSKLDRLGIKKPQHKLKSGNMGLYFDEFPPAPKPEPVKPAFTLGTDPLFCIFKTRKGTLVQLVDEGSTASRSFEMMTLDGSKTRYKVHFTGEAHDDKSTCPDDVVELVNAV